MNNTTLPQNLAFVGSETSSWRAHSFQVLSLLDIMLRFDAYWFFWCITRLDYSIQQLFNAQAQRGGQSLPTAEEVQDIREHLPRLIKHAPTLAHWATGYKHIG